MQLIDMSMQQGSDECVTTVKANVVNLTPVANMKTMQSISLLVKDFALCYQPAGASKTRLSHTTDLKQTWRKCKSDKYEGS